MTVLEKLEQKLAKESLRRLYSMCEKEEAHHYPTSTVLSLKVDGEIVTLTVPNGVLATIKGEMK